MTSYFADYLKALGDKYDPVPMKTQTVTFPFCVKISCVKRSCLLFSTSQTSDEAPFSIDDGKISDIWYYNNMKGLDIFRKKTAELFRDSLSLTNVKIHETIYAA